MDSTRYYKSTGQAPFGAVVSASQFGIFAAIICGALYGIIVCYNPIIYINFLGALVLPLAVGAALKTRFHSGKIRSESVKFWMGGFCGLLAVYCAWWGWLVALSEWDFIFLNPVDLPAIISGLAELGVWDMKGWTPTGWQLYLIWAIEAGVIIVVSTGAGLGDEIPFCEDCDEWTEPVDNAIPIPLSDVDGLRESLEAEEYDVLLDAIGEHVTPSHHFLVKTYKCPDCDESCYLTISELTHSGKEDEEESIDAVIENLVVDLSVVEDISARAKQPIASASVEHDPSDVPDFDTE